MAWGSGGYLSVSALRFRVWGGYLGVSGLGFRVWGSAQDTLVFLA